MATKSNYFFNQFRTKKNPPSVERVGALEHWNIPILEYCGYGVMFIGWPQSPQMRLSDGLPHAAALGFKLLTCRGFAGKLAAL